MHTLIVGGGLSGLAIAEALEKQGRDYTILEARSRFGGRIKTEKFGGGSFDLGPAWFWPGQPRLAAMVQRFGLAKFPQYSDGNFVFEDRTGFVRHHPAMGAPTAWRLLGGLGVLTRALAERIPERKRHLNANVHLIERNGSAITVTLKNGNRFETDHVILALPPRVAANITFSPKLPDRTVQAMRDVPTWMAGQAKALAIYDKAFWRGKGLSGNAVSHRGPLAEVHDATPDNGPPFALFGFIGTPPAGRSDQSRLQAEILEQLERLFGMAAASPAQVIIKDWGTDPYTAVQSDQSPQYEHPHYGLPPAMQGVWDGVIHFAGTEVATEFGGYLEGALVAAENVLQDMQNQGLFDHSSQC